MKNYPISVITPFHNVKKDVFRRCCESMLAQTAGFENVEWIVVVHNSDDESRDAVFELLGNYVNVRIDVLNNDLRTPSSPRNRGLELATSDCVAFLDADDQFTPECLEKALFHMKKNNAQITWFRREYELESEDSVPVTEIVLWDQTREEIVIGRDNRDEEKMFSGVCGMVTSRIYDKRFLDAHGIRFDEDVPFAEDYLFNIMCYGYADTVCYLPQMIGYHYFINSASLVQNSRKDAKTLIAYAKGYKKVFDAGLAFGFYMNAIISGLCGVMARFMIASELTLEDRMAVREILKPYLDAMKPLKVSKLYSEKAVRERYVFPRAVILDPENYGGGDNSDTLIAFDVRTEQSLAPYQRILRDILHVNHRTDIGRRYGFIDILTLSGYQKTVPVSDYALYEPLFRLQTNIGESGIITSDPVRYYIFTLDNSDAARLIPCTDRQFAPLGRWLQTVLCGNRNFLMLESVPQKNRFNDNASVNTLYGAALSELFANDAITYQEKRSLFTAPFELLFPGEIANMTYVRLLFALADRDVSQIIAPNTWEVWESFRFMEKNWRNLCADIASGSPDHFKELISDEYRAVIKSCLTPDPERAAELTAIFEEGFGKPVLPRIWKKLSLVIAFGEAVFSIYSSGMKRYTGNIRHRNGIFSASTAVVGSETVRDGVYRLSSSNAFVEFVPADGCEKAVLAPDVEAGKNYSLLISTYSGLYRYRLSDVVHIEDVNGGVPEFSLMYDASLTMETAGVHVTDDLVGGAVLALGDSAGIPVTDYAYMKNDGGNGIIVLLEIGNDDVDGLDEKVLSERFETLLENADGTYRDAVLHGTLSKAKIAFIEQETQLLYRDLTMNRIGRPTDPIRPVRYINSPAKERFFRSRIIRK